MKESKFSSGLILGSVIALLLSFYVVGWPSFELGKRAGSFIESIEHGRSCEREWYRREALRKANE